MKKSIQGNLIILEGPPAAGKTMIARRLAKELKYILIREPANKMVSWFYRNIDERAFLTQMYFLEKRIMNAEKVNHYLIEGYSVVQDYAFLKDLVYAKQFLGKKEFSLYKNLYTRFENIESSPYRFIFLDCNVNILMRRIQNRNRKGEEKLLFEDLQNIRKNTLSQSLKKYPDMIYVDTSQYKIDTYKKDSDKLFERILNLIQK